MKRIFVLMMGLALAGLAPRASAHEGDAGRGEPGLAGAAAAGNVVVASVVVQGTVAALKADLYQLERWPQVFSDARSLKRNADGTWTVDFLRFGHPHDFRVTRTAGGVVFTLAARDHGEARLEYTLEPVDAQRSRLTIRLVASTPPQLTAEQMTSMLRAKAQSDLDDFSKRAAARRSDGS